METIILEIRAGAGGEEAAIFANDLLRAYSKFAAAKGFKVVLVSAVKSSSGGVKEAILEVSGPNVWNIFSQESGTHRVQRVPKTEKYGRIHTSTVTVAVLKEPEVSEVKIKPSEIKVENFKASGKGGQHVNVTQSAVRITHLPSGLVVSSQDERSSHQNKEKALRILQAKLNDLQEQMVEKQLSSLRRAQIGQAKRAEKIKTYNFPQNRLTDHRYGKSWYNLDDILEGKMDDVLGK